MKHKALFSSKDKSKKLKCRLLQFLFGALRIKCCIIGIWHQVKKTIFVFKMYEYLFKGINFASFINAALPNFQWSPNLKRKKICSTMKECFSF